MGILAPTTMPASSAWAETSRLLPRRFPAVMSGVTRTSNRPQFSLS